VQAKRHLAGRQFGFAGQFPKPVLALGAEHLGEFGAVDADLELAGRAGGFPGANPVLGAHPDAVATRLAHIHLGLRVLDRRAHAVGEQVGRAHDVDELGVEHPAAGVGEGFRLDPERLGLAGQGCGRERGKEETGCFHGRNKWAV
jgi:hypothetical protein